MQNSKFTRSKAERDGNEDGFSLTMIHKLNHMLERRLPERRVFLRSDSETRYLRLSPLTQLVAVTGTTVIAAWIDRKSVV